MNEYIATIEKQKYSIKSDDFKSVIVNGESLNIVINKISEYSYKVQIGNEVFVITTTKNADGNRAFLTNGHYFIGSIRTKLEEMANELANKLSSGEKAKIIKSPMPGLILKINKKIGDKVKAGESLLLLEAMKMENDLKAQTDGIIKEIPVNEGNSVEKNETLIILD